MNENEKSRYTSLKESKNWKLMKRKRIRKSIIETLVILTISGSVITLGIYYKIYELISLSAVVLGWFLATYTVNRYQKTRSNKDLRDKMFLEFQSLAKLSVGVARCWNAWSFKPNDEERQHNVREDSSYLEIATQTFINRINNQYRLDSELERGTLDKLISAAEEYNKIIGNSLSTSNNQNDMRKALTDLSKEFGNYLQLTLFIIQTSKID